jgi:hypothetical protein
VTNGVMSPKNNDSAVPLSPVSHNSVAPLSHVGDSANIFSNSLKLQLSGAEKKIFDTKIEGVEKSHHTTPLNEDNTKVQIIKG